jgi:hypothetical protein
MHIYFSVFTDIPSVYRYPQVKPNPLYPIVGCLWESDTNFSRPVLSTFRPFTACSRPVYGNKFSTAKYIFIRPVLSYFAVATATWQHWLLLLRECGALLPDPARTSRPVQPKKFGRWRKNSAANCYPRNQHFIQYYSDFTSLWWRFRLFRSTTLL